MAYPHQIIVSVVRIAFGPFSITYWPVRILTIKRCMIFNILLLFCTPGGILLGGQFFSYTIDLLSCKSLKHKAHIWSGNWQFQKIQWINQETISSATKHYDGDIKCIFFKDWWDGFLENLEMASCCLFVIFYFNIHHFNILKIFVWWCMQSTFRNVI